MVISDAFWGLMDAQHNPRMPYHHVTIKKTIRKPTVFCWSKRQNHMGVSKNRGTPKWMVKIMENPIKMDDLGGFPPIFGHTHISWTFAHSHRPRPPSSTPVVLVEASKLRDPHRVHCTAKKNHHSAMQNISMFIIQQ